MQFVNAGATVPGGSVNYIKFMQHHPSFRVSSASFVPPPRWKSLLQKLVEFLTQEGQS
ncbi:hypothetical protein HQN64_18950 [Enterobacteriaceae bacterium BIT-l23]|uniref:hypothetical protein n=1 Tax=Jejubacter sp. L23 TaxID=3092086 RepID=UPI0015858A1E|nr:hypothetical protein [Enterobacteriaceae bacterium BIT-l23]